MQYKVICSVCFSHMGNSEKEHDIFVCCQDCLEKETLSDDERDFIQGLLEQEEEGLNKIKEFDEEFEDEFKLINSISNKI